MNEKETGELVESLSDYTFTITECAKTLDDYMQVTRNQSEVIGKLKRKNTTLKKRVAELKESCENMNEVEISLHKQIEILKTAFNLKQVELNLLKNKLEKLEGKF